MKRGLNLWNGQAGEPLKVRSEISTVPWIVRSIVAAWGQEFSDGKES